MPRAPSFPLRAASRSIRSAPSTASWDRGRPATAVEVTELHRPAREHREMRGAGEQLDQRIPKVRIVAMIATTPGAGFECFEKQGDNVRDDAGAACAARDLVRERVEAPARFLRREPYNFTAGLARQCADEFVLPRFGAKHQAPESGLQVAAKDGRPGAGGFSAAGGPHNDNALLAIVGAEGIVRAESYQRAVERVARGGPRAPPGEPGEARDLRKKGRKKGFHGLVLVGDERAVLIRVEVKSRRRQHAHVADRVAVALNA